MHPQLCMYSIYWPLLYVYVCTNILSDFDTEYSSLTAAQQVSSTDQWWIIPSALKSRNSGLCFHRLISFNYIHTLITRSKSTDGNCTVWFCIQTIAESDQALWNASKCILFLQIICIFIIEVVTCAQTNCLIIKLIMKTVI